MSVGSMEAAQSHRMFHLHDRQLDLARQWPGCPRRIDLVASLIVGRPTNAALIERGPQARTQWYLRLTRFEDHVDLRGGRNGVWVEKHHIEAHRDSGSIKRQVGP